MNPEHLRNFLASWLGFPFVPHDPYTLHHEWLADFHDMRKQPGLRSWNRLPRYMTPLEKNKLASLRSRDIGAHPTISHMKGCNLGLPWTYVQFLKKMWIAIDSLWSPSPWPALPTALRLPNVKNVKKKISDPFQKAKSSCFMIHTYIYIYLFTHIYIYVCISLPSNLCFFFVTSFLWHLGNPKNSWPSFTTSSLRRRCRASTRNITWLDFRPPCYGPPRSVQEIYGNHMYMSFELFKSCKRIYYHFNHFTESPSKIQRLEMWFFAQREQCFCVLSATPGEIVVSRLFLLSLDLQGSKV